MPATTAPLFKKCVVMGNGGDPGRTSMGRGFGHTKYDTIDKIELQYLRLASGTYSRLADVRALVKTQPRC